MVGAVASANALTCRNVNTELSRMGGPPRPLAPVAELTHRCPLGCPYCSNSIVLESCTDEIDTAIWAQVFERLSISTAS
jgi:MoaA/NifB/PqqE/SkfB family radical SAM enzyme